MIATHSEHSLGQGTNNEAMHPCIPRPNTMEFSTQGNRRYGELKCAQLNLRQNRTALDLMIKLALENNIEILLLSDPPWTIRRQCRTPGFKLIVPSVNHEECHTAILYKETLQAMKIDSTCGRWCAVQLSIHDQPLTLISVYLSPNNNDGVQELSNQIDLLKDARFVVAGDMNGRSPLWSPLETLRNARGRVIESWLDSKAISLVNSYKSPPTFRSDVGYISWVDLTLSSDKALPWMKDWQVHEDVITHTDHNLITFSIQTNNYLKLTPERRCWKNTDWSNLVPDLEEELTNAGWLNLTWEAVSSRASLNTLVSQLQKDIMKVADRWTPKKRSSTIRKSWWNSEISQMHRALRRTQRKAYKAKMKNRPDAESLKRETMSLKHQLSSLIKQAKAREWQTFLESTDKRSMWKTLNRITRKTIPCDVSTIISSEGETISDENEIVEMLSRRFFPCPPPDSNVAMMLPQSLDEEETFPPISISEVTDAVFSQKQMGSAGHDGIINLLLRKSAHLLCPLLQRIANQCLRLGLHCDTWKLSTVIPIYKSQSQSQSQLNKLSNLRPISLIPVIGKVLEKIMAVRIGHWLESKGLISSAQFGFRKFHSCELSLLNFTGKAEKARTRNCPTSTVSLDIASAFDSVRPTILLKRIQDLGLPSYMTSWLQSFLSQRRGNLAVGQNCHTIPVHGACPQGSPISPLLFSIYINPLLELGWNNNEQPVHIQAFADDILLWCSLPDDNANREHLQRALDLIQSWCSASGFSINAAKCNVMTIRPSKKWQSQNDTPPQLSIQDKSIEERRHFKYLGVLIDEDLDWSAHIAQLERKSLAKLTTMRRLMTMNWGFTNIILSKIFQMAIIPMMYYGASVWGKIIEKPSSLAPLEKVTRQFGIFILGCLRTTSYACTYLLSGIRPPHLEIPERILLTGRRLSRQDHLNKIASESSFIRILQNESRRLVRSSAVPVDPLTTVKLTPRGQDPSDQHLLLSRVDSNEPPSNGSIKIFITLRHREDTLIISWSSWIDNHEETSHRRLPPQLSIEDGESFCLPDIISSAMSHWQKWTAEYGQVRTPLRCFIYSKFPSTWLRINSKQNIPEPIARTQSIITLKEAEGWKFFWNHPYYQDGFTFRCLCAIEQSNKAVNVSTVTEELLTLNDIGIDDQFLKCAVQHSFDSRTNEFLQQSEEGRAILDLQIPFRNKTSPTLQLEVDRFTGSALNRFVSNHFISGPYFKRFHISDRLSLCHHNCRHSTYRDHLIFRCSSILFASVREKVCAEISRRPSSLSWLDLLNQPAQLIPLALAVISGGESFRRSPPSQSN